MRYRQCTFEAVKFFAGTYATAFLLGSLGFFFHIITNNVVVGYLAAFTYYLLNVALGRKLKYFYLFTLARSMKEKLWITGAGLLLIAIALLWKSIFAKKGAF